MFENDITDLVLSYVWVLDRVVYIILSIIHVVWLIEFEILHEDISYVLTKRDAVKLWDLLTNCGLAVEERILVHTPACWDYVHWPLVQHHSVFLIPKLQQVLVVQLNVFSLGFR